MKTPPIYFIRHGQTDWNAEYRYQGQQDIPLNDIGREQARRNGRMLAQLLPDPSNHALYCSPLGRTRQTLALILQEAGWQGSDWAQSVEYTTDLLEISFGDWEGWTLEEIREREPEDYWAREENKWATSMPNGESYEVLAGRVGRWLARLTGPSVVVAHGGVMRMIRYHLEAVPQADAPGLSMPQDKILYWDGEKSAWL